MDTKNPRTGQSARASKSTAADTEAFSPNRPILQASPLAQLHFIERAGL